MTTKTSPSSVVAAAAVTAPPTSLIATLESHLSPTLAFTSPSTSPTQPSLHLIATPTLTKLRNLGPGRLKDMRSLGHTRQIISHIPILAAPQACSKYNDAMASAVLMNAEKFAVLAMLPNDGKEAARELVRCVNRYGFVGGVVALGKGGGGMQVDREEWWELWNQAEKFRIPILIRGLWPLASEVAEYQHHLPFGVLGPILTHLHTSHTMSSLPIVHLYLNCVFDRHPNLRLILAHPGALPSLIPRIENLLTSIPAADKPKRGFLDVWQHNIYVTTADAQDMSSLRALLEQIPVDRVLYASNYPLEERSKELMEELRESGFLTQIEYEMIAWVNAETLLNLKGRGARGGR